MATAEIENENVEGLEELEGSYEQLMKLETHVWKITGVSPLMQSNPASMEDDSQATADLTTKKTYNDKHEAQIRCYTDDDGRYVHPSSAFRKGMMQAVIGKKFGKVAARMIVGSGVYPSEEWIPILNAKGQPMKKYEIDKRSVIIGKARIMRCRPKFKNWTMKLPLDINTAVISATQVTQALNLMGRDYGIGEFRPDPRNTTGVGTFGRFKAEFVK